MKYTKGEWKQRQLFDEPLTSVNENGCGWYHNDISIHDESGRVICSVNYSTDHKDMGWGQNETIEKWKANAKLIAAAPELLEFAQLFSGQLANGIIDTLKAKEGHYKEVADMVRLNISAIKKATLILIISVTLFTGCISQRPVKHYTNEPLECSSFTGSGKYMTVGAINW